MDERGWNAAELARRTEIARGPISGILNGLRNPGPDLCIAIAKGLNVPRSEVFKARGWLLSEPQNQILEVDPRVEKLAHEINALPFGSREITLDAMEAMLQSTRQLTHQIQQLSTNGQHA